MTWIERLRGGRAPFLLYPLLALASFPTLGSILAGEHGLAYALDVFDLPRSGVGADWLAHGPTLWNTHLSGGNAILAQQAISPYAPDVLLALLIGPFGALAVMGWLIAAVAGIGMHLFLRDSLRLSTAAVVGGATIYLFGFWHLVYGFSVVILPLALWLSDRAVRADAHRWRPVAASALIGAFGLYAGLSQLVLLLAAMQLAYLLTVGRGEAGLRGRLAIWAGTWALAFALYGPVLITQLVMLPISQRTVWELYDAGPIQAIRDSLEHYSAVLFGLPVGQLVGGSPGRYGTYFLGAIGLPLLILGLVGARRDRRARFLLALLVAIPVIDLVAVLLAPLQDQLGFLKSFQLVRVRHFFSFALAANAALGLDMAVGAILAGGPILPRGRWRRAIVLSSFFPLAMGLVIAGREVIRRRDALVGLDQRALGWALGSIAVGAALLAVVALVVALARHRTRLRRAGEAVVVAFVLLLAAERATYVHAERLIGSNIGTYADALAVTPGQAFLLEQPGIDVDRVLTFGEEANRMGAVGLLQVDGYQAIYPVTYHRFFGELIAPQLARDPVKARYYLQWGNRAVTFGPNVDAELAALAGARWLYVKGAEVPTVPGIVARWRGGDVTVYEVTSVLPRAFIVGAIDVRRDNTDVVASLGTASLDDLRGRALMPAGIDADGLGSELPDGGVGTPGPAGVATITAYAPDRVELDVRADRPGVLILTDVMAPGWVAERDGVAVPIATVDETFRGVAVDPASRRVVFRYLPGFTYAGFGLACLAAVTLGGWAWWLRRRDGRAAPPRERSAADVNPA